MGVCEKPYVTRETFPVGCGKCLPCRSGRRRLWAHRMMLEAQCHGASSFVTLTYAPDRLPGGATLVPKHTQDWLKRLRRKVGTLRLRYFLVGEYGEDSGRPHYHVALFGLGPSSKKLIEESWSHGFVQIGMLTEQSASYIAKYVTKGLTCQGDGRLEGRVPEFARMSLRPGGIGFGVIAPVVSSLKRPGVVERLGVAVPKVLRVGGSLFPLGRYLRRKIGEAAYGDGYEKIREVEKAAYSREMLELYKGEYVKPENAAKSFAAIIADRDSQKVLNLKARFAIKKSSRRNVL